MLHKAPEGGQEANINYHITLRTVTDFSLSASGHERYVANTYYFHSLFYNTEAMVVLSLVYDREVTEMDGQTSHKMRIVNLVDDIFF